VRIRALPRSDSVSGDGYALEARRRSFETVTAAQALIRCGVVPSKAKAAVEALVAGKKIYLYVPLADQALVRDLTKAGVETRCHRVPASIDVAAIRKRFGITQEEFAARFGLNLATIRNWEQRRSYPDEAARGYLTVIATNAEAAEKAVSIGEELALDR